ncbi:TetR/AcrR family transcriptional regulator [Bacillus sp. 2205SS5-2]|uniref:TetR/AcrR family transcriptional regulator n=1 Tax=Bacillus sp. 2205SS5-2 TaxID=3109031 RepID=UPI003006058C
MSDKYTKILDTAYRLFAENGFEKTSMSLIAKEVGITKPAIYYYFPSKNALIHTLFQYLVKQIHFSKFFQQEEYTVKNFKGKLIADGHKMIEQQAQDPHYSNIMSEYHLLSTRETQYGEGLKETLAGFLNGFISLLEVADSYGLLMSTSVQTSAQFLTIIVDGLDKYAEKEFQFNAEDIWEMAVTSIIKGE